MSGTLQEKENGPFQSLAERAATFEVSWQAHTHLLQALIQHVEHQDEEIKRLASKVVALENTQATTAASLLRDVSAQLQQTVGNVIHAVEAVRDETRAAVPHDVVGRLEFVERALDGQQQINTMCNAEILQLQSDLQQIMSRGGVSVASPSNGRHTVLHAGDDTSMALWVHKEGQQRIDSLVRRVDDLRGDLDDLLTLFEIPRSSSQHLSSSVGKPPIDAPTDGSVINPQTPRIPKPLHKIASFGTPQQRIQFLHALPCFRVLVEGTSPASPQQRAPLHDGSVYVPHLQADVVGYSHSGGKSVRIVRLVRGGAAQLAGLQEGDVVVTVDGTSMAGPWHLVDYLQSVVRAASGSDGSPPPAVEIGLLPAGRDRLTQALTRASVELALS